MERRSDMLYIVYIMAGLVGGILIGMSGLTAAMVLTPILTGICGWKGYDATTMSLLANIPSAIVTSYTYYKNGNVDIRRSKTVSMSAFIGAVAGSWMGYLFSRVSEGGISYLVIAGNLGMAYKFLHPAKDKKGTAKEEQRTDEMRKTALALLLSFLIGAECGFMGSAGGMMMLMVLTLVLGMNTREAVGSGSVVMTLVALTGAVSHLMMGAVIDPLPAAVITISCTVGAVSSAKLANRISEKQMSRCAGVVLLLVSIVSLLLNH